MDRAPARPLLALTLAVVAAHLFLLRGLPERRSPAEPVVLKNLVTRTVAPEPAPASPAAQAVAPTAAADPAPRPPAAPRTLPVATPPAEPARPVTAEAPPAPPAPQVATAPRAALAIPGSMRLRYQVDIQARGQTVQGQGELTWRHDGESYEARLELKSPLLPARTQHSTGRLTAGGLAPLRFSDRNRSEEATHFEREKGKVSFSSNRPDAPLLTGTQDRLSVMLQLAAMVAGEPSKFPPGTTISIPTATTREAEPWLFIVEGEEDLALPGGKMRGLKLVRNPRKEFDSKVELWLAPGMDYAPVRLRLTQPNGDSADQQWSSTDRG
ncbi:MAG: DUF3108 domain-containing protein [Ramlibacter sp.]